MVNRLKIFVFCLGLLLLAGVVGGCGGGGGSGLGATASGDAAEYFPVTVGSSWVMSSESSSGNLITAEGAAIVSGESVQVFRSTYGGYDTVHEVYYRLDANGVSVCGEEGYLYSLGEIRYFGFPLQEGYRWNCFASYSGIYGVIEAVNEVLTVEAGTYNCVRIRLVSNASGSEVVTSRYWLGRGVGIVKTFYPPDGTGSELIWTNL